MQHLQEWCQRVFYLMANRNQRDLAIDLKSEEGRETIYTLIRDKGYDVIIENFRPGVMDKLGLGYEKLKEINPRVVYCSCTGYGSAGPKAKKPGQDTAASGHERPCRPDRAERPPAYAGRYGAR